MSRLDDGPAVVTAMALSPRDGAMVIGYADGTTLIWQLDQSSFEPRDLAHGATALSDESNSTPRARSCFFTGAEEWSPRR